MIVDIIIPSRYKASRFPGKPLADISGKPMIVRVWEQAQKIKGVRDVYVATDHPDIEDVIKNCGGQVIITSENHPSGTDRIHEALKNISNPPEVVMNIQGDEPFFPPSLGEEIISSFKTKDVGIVTACTPFIQKEEVENPNRVKVVFNQHGKALFFSRSPIPFEKNQSTTHYLHMGVYAFRTQILQNLSKLPPSNLEMTESLEQLRWLEAGYDIYMVKTHCHSPAVDTPDDLKIAIKFANMNT